VHPPYRHLLTAVLASTLASTALVIAPVVPPARADFIQSLERQAPSH